MHITPHALGSGLDRLKHNSLHNMPIMLLLHIFPLMGFENQPLNLDTTVLSVHNTCHQWPPLSGNGVNRTIHN